MKELNYKEGIFAMNRSESSLIAKLFAGYFFNDYIFPKNEPLKFLINDIFDSAILENNIIAEKTFFIRPKNLFRILRRVIFETENQKTTCSEMENGHFDIGIHVLTKKHESLLFLFEIKYLSDIKVKQLLHEQKLCAELSKATIKHNGEETKFDKIYFITICTWANLHYTKALQVNDKGIVTVPTVGMLPENTRVTTFDKVAEVIIKTLKLSRKHEVIGTNILKTLYNTSDIKTLSKNGNESGVPRHLLHTSKREIELLEIV